MNNVIKRVIDSKVEIECFDFSSMYPNYVAITEAGEDVLRCRECGSKYFVGVVCMNCGTNYTERKFSDDLVESVK